MKSSSSPPITSDNTAASQLLLSDEDGFVLNLSDDDASTEQAADSAKAGALRPLLIVDDEEMLLEMLEKLFRERYDVRVANSGEAALELLHAGFHPEVIIADQRMPGLSGAEFLSRSREFLPQTVRIVLTGYTDVNDIIDSINLGSIYRFITKPWNPDELLETVRLSYEHYDMTTRNVELTQALEALEKLSHEKSELMGVVAHDLKNPIGASRFAAEMLLSAGAELSEQDVKQFATLIYEASDRALTLIADLLSVEAIERGGKTLAIQPVDAIDLVSGVVQQYRLAAHNKHLTLHWASAERADSGQPSKPEEMPFVAADVAILRQVMDNILSNAVKYSPHHKQIWIEVGTRASLSQPSSLLNLSTGSLQMLPHSVVVLGIRDEGPGLSDDDKKRLFGKFARLSAQPTGGESSTGLGLAIAKRYVEAMQGYIWCESEFGKGSTFCVALPVADTSHHERG
jgi:signal transduction histidine kinase